MIHTNEEQTRSCTKCGVDKPLSAFSYAGTRLKRTCKVCDGIRSRTWKLANKEKVAETRRLYDETHQDFVRSQKKIYRDTKMDKEAASIYGKQYRADNIEVLTIKSKERWANRTDEVKEKQKEYNKAHRQEAVDRVNRWRENNPDKMHALSAKRRAHKLHADVPWADLDKIKQIYKESEERSESTGIRHHVDHIIPLQHPLVCGLHVENNLQVITEAENLSKNNKFEPILTMHNYLSVDS